MHLPLRLIFCRRCLNFINVRAAYASKIQAPPTKNLLANSGTTRFREHIIVYGIISLKFSNKYYRFRTQNDRDVFGIADLAAENQPQSRVHKRFREYIKQKRRKL